MKISDIGEKRFIQNLRRLFYIDNCEFVRTIGDDAAVIRLSEDCCELLTVDTFVEGIHFDLSYTSPRDAGRRSMGAALSDIAAMGGRPSCALISISISGEIKLDVIHSIMRGINDYARTYNCPVIGGETTSITGPMVIAITVRGEVEKKLLITRSGAGPGEGIYVTGTLGDSRAGLEILKEDIQITARKQRKAFLRPVPRIQEAQFIAENLNPTAAIDISDGLSTDLGHICDESGIGARIYWQSLPLSPGTRKIARLMNIQPQMLAVNGGEDFELLFTAKSDSVEKLKGRFYSRFGISFVRIGETTNCKGKPTIVMPDESEISLKSEGYDHFIKYEKR